MLSPENNCFHPCIRTIATRDSTVPFVGLVSDIISRWTCHTTQILAVRLITNTDIMGVELDESVLPAFAA